MSEGKVSSGQPFYPPPARIWNNMIDAGQAFADGRFSQPAGPPIRPRETDILKLKNSSGGNRRQGEVLKISGKVIETVNDESIWLNGIEPTAACRFGILKRPLLTDEVDNAQVSGVCIAKVNITDTSHTFADVADGEYVLQSGDSGAVEILYAPSETGEADCVVRFAAIHRRFAVLTENLPAAPSVLPTGTAAADDDEITTDIDLTAFDDYVVVIAGAGVAGASHVSVILSSTSSTITLAQPIATTVTDAEITILAVADAFPIYRRNGGRWTRILDSTGVSYERYPVVNSFQSIELTANTLVGIEWIGGMWEIYKADCEAGVWEWGEY